MTAPNPIDELREHLLEIKPAGSDGFEGLIADALASITGLVFRLAKSGSQFGRDAMTERAPFAVAMEAKRYRDNLTLENLQGKASIAARELEGKVDLWVLAATSAVGDDIQSKVADALAKAGISLLTLDWTPHPLPPLVVLLTSARGKAETWFAAHLPAVASTTWSRIFDAIASDTDFPAQRDHLLQSMQASTIGLGALRIHSTTWLRERFIDRDGSQRAFGQYITVSDPAAFVVTRAAPLKALGDAVTSVLANPAPPGLIVTLGEEGCGKTWVIARWLADLSPSPIVVFVAGNRTGLLDPAKPVQSLAKLLAEQDGDESETAIAEWEKRLARWRQSGWGGTMRFVIVLDGLNEHAGMPWAGIVKSMLQTVSELGGCVIASCRPKYWEREISIRLGSLPTISVVVGDYDETELALVLNQQGIDPASLPQKLREFIRNPRVCAVALKLLPRLDQPDALTVERLLLEYWRARLEERGDLISHTVPEFHKLLRNHAKAWFDKPDTPFDRDQWIQRSVGANDQHGKEFVNDLTDIEEGRFMQVSDIDEGGYEFKQETLPFAIGLLIIHELKAGAKTGDARELLQRILEPIRGFDVMSSALLAATGLACWDKNYPQAARVALVEASLSMQNPDLNLFSALTAHVSECPEAFFDVAELTGINIQLRQLLNLLLVNRDKPKVAKGLVRRLPKWLGWWSRQMARRSTNIGAEQQAKYGANIAAMVEKLSPGERNFFDNECFEGEERTTVSLPYLAALLMAGRSQAHLAKGLFASELATTIAADIYSTRTSLAWVVRLNRVDFFETEKAVLECYDEILGSASGPFRLAGTWTMKLLGSRALAERTNDLSPMQQLESRRRVERLCDTNPYDPAALMGSNLDNARLVLERISGAQIWNHSSFTLLDMELEDVTPALTRFDAAMLIATLREVIGSIVERTAVSFWHLALYLPGLSPLYNSAQIEFVMAAYDRLISTPELVADNELILVAERILNSLLPHFDADWQLTMLLKLPPSVPALDNFLPALAVLEAARLTDHLEQALNQQDSLALERVLLFASAKPAALTGRAREIVVESLSAKNDTIVCGAANIVWRAEDNELDRMVLEQATPYDKAEAGIYPATLRRRAIAAALIRQKRLDRLPLVSPAFIGHVSRAFGEATYPLLGAAINKAVSRLLQPINTLPPVTCKLVVAVSHDGLETMSRAQDLDAPSPYLNDDLDAKLERFFADSHLSGDRFDAIQTERRDEITKFEEGLGEEDAVDLLSNLSWADAVLVAQHDAAQVARWLDQILAIHDRGILGNVYNFGIILAGAYATHDAHKAIQLLEHLRDIDSSVTVNVGMERIPLYLQTLFKTGTSSAMVTELDPLRERFFAEAFTDADLESGVISADACGASAWLDGYMDRLLASNHPGEQARGLAIAGLRHENAIAKNALSQPWCTGFLGEVAAYANKIYQKHEWASHWFAQAAATDDPVDFWRYGQLAKGIADRRFYTWLKDAPKSDLFQRFGAELICDLKKAAEERSNKRKKTLFGLAAPDNEIRFALLN